MGEVREFAGTLVLRSVNAAPDMVPNAAIFRHHQNFVDTTGLEARKNPQDYIGPVGDLQGRGVGNHPADVTRRDGVGNDADHWTRRFRPPYGQ